MANVGSKLTTGTMFIKDINSQIRKGEIKVPQFQRPFVWKDEQAIQLLDSVANNYPVGSVLLWRTPEKLATERSIGDFKLPDTAALTPTDYILDGQQRMTVLYAALGAELDADGFSASYNLDTAKFTPAHADDADLRHIFPLRLILENTTELLNFRTALQEHVKGPELQTRLDNLIEVFTRYQIPVVTLRDLTLEEVCPIFERVNSTGTELSVYDLMVAATWSPKFDLNETVASVADALKPKNYGDIKGTTVLKCMSAVRTGSTARERILALRTLRETPADMDKLVAKTKRALERGVDRLVTDFKLHSLDFLPYEAHLVILAYIFSQSNTLNATQSKRLRQWFWRTSFAERYRGAPDDFVTRDLQSVREFVVSGRTRPDQFGTIPTRDELSAMIFRKNNSRSRAFALALAKQEPRNLLSGSLIDTTAALSIYNKKQFHHIFPDAFLRKKDKSIERNYLMNFCMLSAEENNAIAASDPQQYLPETIEGLGADVASVFRSNLLPLPTEYDYSSAELGTFIEARVEVVHSVITALCDGKS